MMSFPERGDWSEGGPITPSDLEHSVLTSSLAIQRSFPRQWNQTRVGGLLLLLLLQQLHTWGFT